MHCCCYYEDDVFELIQALPSYFLTTCPMKKILALVLLSTLFLSACSKGPKDEKQAYIDASIESICLMYQTEDILDPQLEVEAKEIYEKYGFDTDDAALEELTNKYKDDADVKSQIVEGFSKCSEKYVNAIQDTSTEDANTEEVDDNSAEEESSEEEKVEKMETEEVETEEKAPELKVDDDVVKE